MIEYSYEGGLSVLKYLNITLTDKEITFFKTEWRIYFENTDNDFLRTILRLYNHLAYIYEEDPRKAQSTAVIRDKDFGEKIKVARLEERLKGSPLQEVLSNNHARFITN